MNNKIIAGILALAFVTGGLAVPVASHAQDGSDVSARLCIAADDARAKFDTGLDKIVDEVNARHNTFLASVDDKQALYDEILEESQADWNEARDAIVEDLNSLEPTPPQEAIDSFIASIDEARVILNIEKDTAQSQFFTDLETIGADLRDTILNSIDEFRADVHAAFDAAKARCGDDVPDEENRELFEEDIDAARADFATDRESFNVAETLEPILTARTDAMSNTKVTFTQSLQAAKEDLRQAWLDVGGVEE